MFFRIDMYGRFNQDDIRSLFRDILGRNDKAYILLCGKAIVDLFAPSSFMTKEWEERVLVEDFE